MAVMKMPAVGVESGSDDFYTNATLVQTGLSVNDSRCTIEKGGYFVKSGVCYFDITLAISFNSTGNSSYLLGVPLPTTNNSALAGNNGSNWVAQTGNYFTSKDTNTKNGDTIRIIGAYATSASDT